MKDAVLRKAMMFQSYNKIALKGEVVVYGSTSMANFPFYELINKSNLQNAIYNRSIEGMTVAEARALLDMCVLPLKPKKLFLSLGEIDEDVEVACLEYAEILKRVRVMLPDCKVYVIYPLERDERVRAFNAAIASLCDEKNVIAIRFPGGGEEASLNYKKRFKILSCFFRDARPSMSDMFAIADL